MFQISRPPKPPSGQGGCGSYVWVPYRNEEKEKDDVFLEEQQAGVDLMDDITEEDDNGSAHTDKEYEDVCTPNDIDGEQFEESGIVGEEEEDMGQIVWVVCDLLNFHHRNNYKIADLHLPSLALAQCFWKMWNPWSSHLLRWFLNFSLMTAFLRYFQAYKVWNLGLVQLHRWIQDAYGP